jgi:hypothetical protein
LPQCSAQLDNVKFLVGWIGSTICGLLSGNQFGLPDYTYIAEALNPTPGLTLSIQGERIMKRSGVPIIFACVLTTVMITGCSMIGSMRGPKKYNLKYDLPKGSTFAMKISRDDHFVRNIMGNEAVMDIKDVIEYGFEVKSSSKQGLTLELEYRNRSHQTDVPQFQAGVDFSSLVGSKAGFDISSRGEPSGFTGFEKLPVIRIPDQEASLGEAQYVSEIRQIFPILPDRPVSIGETWSYKHVSDEPTEGGQIKITVDSNYTLLEESEKDGFDCMKISAKYTLNVEGEVSSGGMRFTVKGGGEGSDIIYFAQQKGMFLNSEGDLVIEAIAENSDLGISVPVKHEYKTTVDVSLDQE